MALDRISDYYDFGPWRSRFNSFVVEGRVLGERVLLIKPNSFYNKIGIPVFEVANFFKIDVCNIFVFHDEIDLAPGKLRVKFGGGLAGNNGLRSIHTQFKSTDFFRIRIGVGHPGDKSKVAGYVLHDFSKLELVRLNVVLNALSAGIQLLLAGETQRLQSDIAQKLKYSELNDIEKYCSKKNDAISQTSRF